MSPIMRTTSLFLVACLLLSTACAHNITKILEKESDFSNFNQLLSQTGLAKEINGRKTITVLAVPNDAMGGLNGKPTEEAKNILKTHIILDYYDTVKLNNLKKSTEMTTLFQSTGVAHYSQGFLNVTKKSDGVYFGSAVKNSQRDAKLTGSVASLPYNISVLSISHAIDTPGMTDVGEPVSAPPPKKAKAPSPDTEETESPVESPPPEEAPEPAPEEEKSKSPEASAPGPDADSEAADKQSSSGKLFVSTTFALAAVLASCFAAF